MVHLRDDFVPQIPRQNEEIIRPGLVDSGYWINWNVHAGSKAPVLVGVTVDSEVEEIGTDSAVVKQCVSFTGRAISAQLRALLLALNQEGQKLALRVINSSGKPSVATNVLKSDIAFVSEQHTDARRNCVARSRRGKDKHEAIHHG